MKSQQEFAKEFLQSKYKVQKNSMYGKQMSKKSNTAKTNTKGNVKTVKNNHNKMG